MPRSTLLLRSLRSALAAAEMDVTLGYDRLAAITARPRSSLCRWLHGEAEPAAETLLLLLERLAPAQRHQLLDGFCRVYPTLEHPQLSHDPTALAHLRHRLAEPTGLTLIRGEETLVTFLLTAIAHSLSGQPAASPQRAVIGVDRHRPDWFVPAAGVAYVPDPAAALAALIQRATISNGAVILVNTGVAGTERFADWRKLAAHHHVLLADAGRSRALPDSKTGCRRIEVTPRTQPDRIQLQMVAD